MWLLMVLSQQMCLIYLPLEFESQSESERCLAAFFSHRVKGTERRRADKLKHMWTLRAHKVSLFWWFFCLPRPLYRNWQLFGFFFRIHKFFIFETDRQKSATCNTIITCDVLLKRDKKILLLCAAAVVSSSWGRMWTPAGALHASSAAGAFPACTDVPHNEIRGEVLHCHPAEEVTASQRLMILGVESFLMPRRHCYKNRPPPLCFPRWHIKAKELVQSSSRIPLTWNASFLSFFRDGGFVFCLRTWVFHR